VRGVSALVLLALALAGFAVAGTAPPSIMGVTAATGGQAGRVFTVSGLHLAQLTAVKVGGTRLNFTVVSPRKIIVRVPARLEKLEVAYLFQHIVFTFKQSGQTQTDNWAAPG